MKEEAQKKVDELSHLEQNAQNLISQRHNLQTRLLEIESALEEINGSEVSKIIGNIVVKVKSEKIKKELKEKKDLITKRLELVKKEESKYADKAETLRNEVLKLLEKNNEE